jgi:hypothetical protein
MPDKLEKNSRRSLVSILASVLEWVRSDEYMDFGEFMVFGVMFSDEVPEPFRKKKREAYKALKLIDEYVSGVRVGRRTSLSKDEEFARRVDKAGLSDRGREVVRLILGGMDANEMKLAKSGLEDPYATGAIEEHFARELVRKLPKIVKRASSLDEVSDEEIHKGIVPHHVNEYFKEAHRCYLYGFPVACAVLCRAILASALESLCDPTGTMKQSIPTEKYFTALVEKARRSGLLTDDRPAWANDIRNAGNDAIHDHAEFQKRWRGRLDEILLNTRKIALDLYTRPS